MPIVLHLHVQEEGWDFALYLIVFANNHVQRVRLCLFLSLTVLHDEPYVLASLNHLMMMMRMMRKMMRMMKMT
jgi:hypothetical protein